MVWIKLASALVPRRPEQGVWCCMKLLQTQLAQRVGSLSSPSFHSLTELSVRPVATRAVLSRDVP